MKRLHLLILLSAGATLLLLAGCGEHSLKKKGPRPALTAADIAVGMPLADFLSIFPQAKLTAEGQWSRPDELYGLDGDWTYSFDHKVLSWYLFNSYESNVNEENFGIYLDAARRALEDLSQRFGQPAQAENGVTEFRDPAQGYSGYPVLSASWTTAQDRLRLDFSFLSTGQGEGQFLFTIEYRR